MINRRRCACERRANSLWGLGSQGLGMELDAQSSRGPVGLSGRLRPVELARKARTGLVPKERVRGECFLTFHSVIQDSVHDRPHV